MSRSLVTDRLRVAFEQQRRVSRSRDFPSVAPTLSYGRQRGPALAESRIAAVAITLYQNEHGQWILPLTLRPETLSHHGGQISLPGGQVEPSESVLDAALREFEEELGVPAKVEHFFGELATQYVYASNNLVHPLVMAIETPTEQWNPDPVEVAEVIELPLDSLLDPQSRMESIRRKPVCRGNMVVDHFNFRATGIRHQEHNIWGATGLILDQLAQLLR